MTEQAQVIDETPDEIGIDTLGPTYFEGMMHVIENCHANKVDLPTVTLPLFSVVLMAESLECTGNMAELFLIAKTEALTAARETIDQYTERFAKTYQSVRG